MNHVELIKLLTPMYGAGEARAVVRLVMEERFGLSQTDLLLGKGTTLSRDERNDFEKIAARLVQGEPVQYVLGYASFCGHRFRVTPDVLIPRPETEDLVGRVVQSARAQSAFGYDVEQPSFNVLDLCTGSGCIAIAVALALPAANVVGVDISLSALTVARENAHELWADNVSFLESDVLQSDKAKLIAELGRPNSPIRSALQPDKPDLFFDVLVSNPPYVRECEAAEMSRHVLDHEPRLALFVPDDDALLFYHAIADIGRRCLKPGGTVLVEVNTALAGDTQQLFLNSGYTDAMVFDDQFGRPRIVQARK